MRLRACFCEMTLLHGFGRAAGLKIIRAREAGKTRFNDKPAEPDDRSLESNVCNGASKDS